MKTRTAPPETITTPEVFARTPKVIAGETCEKCGASTPARYVAEKGDLNLFFCAHHIRQYHTPLKAQGFNVTPEDISYNAA